MVRNATTTANPNVYLFENTQNSCLMRLLLLLVVIHELSVSVYSINGVIWDKNTKDFVPIFSIRTFAALNQEFLDRSRADETHNFQGKNVKFSYYKIKNIIDGENNGTSVTGFIGETWNILAELLNFTLKLDFSAVNTVGTFTNIAKTNNTLLKKIYYNKTDVIGRLEAYSERSGATQFSYPMFVTRYRYYMRANVTHDHNWLFKLYSKKVWFAILVTYVLFSFSSYLTRIIDFEVRKKPIMTIRDHFFYNLGVICSQTSYLNSNSKSAKLVDYLLGMFTLIIRTAFNALIIGYMMQTSSFPPLQELDTILKSSLNLYAVKGSVISAAYELFTSMGTMKSATTFHSVPTVEDVYKALCTSKDSSIGILSTDVKKASGMYICRINPAGDSPYYFNVVSGIAKNFKHKRSIDIGLLKINEHGIGRRLWYRWIESQDEEDHSNMPQAVVLDQIYLVMVIFYCGFLISLILLILENVMFYYRKKRFI